MAFIGLKRVDAFKKGLPADSDMFITSNDLERSFIINDLGYAPEEVVVTGLSRWDVLEDKSAKAENKRILVMPTWRKWLDEASDEVFLSSEYYHRYMDLINSPTLAEILRGNDLHLNFYIHPKLSELLGKFSASDDRIRLIPFGTEPLNELMMECRLLITDYSSVCWDVYYQGKPVIFYQLTWPSTTRPRAHIWTLRKISSKTEQRLRINCLNSSKMPLPAISHLSQNMLKCERTCISILTITTVFVYARK